MQWDGSGESHPQAPIDRYQSIDASPMSGREQQHVAGELPGQFLNRGVTEGGHKILMAMCRAIIPDRIRTFRPWKIGEPSISRVSRL